MGVTDAEPHFRKLDLMMNCRMDSRRKMARNGKTS